jgi:hypothetical protein
MIQLSLRKSLEPKVGYVPVFDRYSIIKVIEIKERKMSRTYSSHGKNEKYKILVRKPERNRQLERIIL